MPGQMRAGEAVRERIQYDVPRTAPRNMERRRAEEPPSGLEPLT